MNRDAQKIMMLYMSFPITNDFDNSDEDYDDEEEEDDYDDNEDEEYDS